MSSSLAKIFRSQQLDHADDKQWIRDCWSSDGPRVPRTRTCLGDRLFAIAGLCLRNNSLFTYVFLNLPSYISASFWRCICIAEDWCLATVAFSEPYKCTYVPVEVCLCVCVVCSKQVLGSSVPDTSSWCSDARPLSLVLSSQPAGRHYGTHWVAPVCHMSARHHGIQRNSSAAASSHQPSRRMSSFRSS